MRISPKIELEFRIVDFLRSSEEKQDPERNPQGKGENQQTTQRI
jgi:hypothetical protein